MATVMKGGNFYNQNSEVQRRGISHAESLIQNAVDQMLESLLKPIITTTTTTSQSISNSSFPKVLNVGDLGCSQGANSMAPVNQIIQQIRQHQMLSSIPICVYHEDQIFNDFNSLFEVLNQEDNYPQKFHNVFTYVQGRSFYQRLFPPKTMNIIFSFMALHWMSTVPPVKKVSLFCGSNDFDAEDNAVWSKVGQNDFSTFLNHRHEELVTGGKLVLTFACLSPHLRAWNSAIQLSDHCYGNKS